MKEKHTYHAANESDFLPEALRVNPYAVPTQASFKVPANYFEQLEENIAAKIAAEKLKDVVQDTGFEVPEGYFASVEDQLMAEVSIRIQVEDTGFGVPEHYFATLQDKIASRTFQKPDTPTRKISQPRKWMIYAAASVVLVISFVGFFNVGNEDNASANDTNVGAKHTLASVSDQEILSYLEFYGTANDVIDISEHLDHFNEPSIGEGLSEEDIEVYLNHML